MNEKTPAAGGVSRRSFLAAASVAAGATIVRPAAVRSSEANSKINIGCVGLGGRGHWIAGLFKAHGGYNITGCADYFPEVSKTEGQKLGVPEARCFSGLLGYQRLLATDVDAMILETPTCFFPTHATASVAAGKHVYMAKPLATDVPGTLAIRAAGEKATKDGKVFLIDFQMRVNPYLMECVKRIREGKMNGLRFIRAFYDDEGREVPKREKTIANLLRELAWGMDVAIGGDRILVAGIHALDAALFLTNEAPVSCIGISKTVGEGATYDSADVYALSYLFPSGCLMDFSSEYLRNYRGFNCGLEATGTNSYLESKYDGLTWMRGSDWRYKGGETPNAYADGAKTNIDIFYKSVTGGVHDNPTVETSVQSNLTGILGREAGRRQRLVTMDEILKENKKIEVNLEGLVE
jgi:myo-inositol 2-dehydrogenase / D-chiro-inositol 1-dehydrogenase